MITNKAFSDTLADWIERHLLNRIPTTATFMRGIAKTTAAVLKIRPKYVEFLVTLNYPEASRLGIFRDDVVDSEILRLTLENMMSEVKEYDLGNLIPRFTYRATDEDVKSLSEYIKKAEATAQVGGSCDVR